VGEVAANADVKNTHFDKSLWLWTRETAQKSPALTSFSFFVMTTFPFCLTHRVASKK
jgi:hypothetical protein